MKLKELMSELLALPHTMGDCEVIISCDAEGNQYSPLSCVTNNNLCPVPLSYKIDEIFLKNWTSEEAGMTKKEWSQFKKKTPTVIVLYPTT